MISGIWGVAEIQFWIDQDTWTNLGFELTPKEYLEEL
jgi:hypothetical protein